MFTKEMFVPHWEQEVLVKTVMEMMGFQVCANAIAPMVFAVAGDARGMRMAPGFNGVYLPALNAVFYNAAHPASLAHELCHAFQPKGSHHLLNKGNQDTGWDYYNHPTEQEARCLEKAVSLSIPAIDALTKAANCKDAWIMEKWVEWARDVKEDGQMEWRPPFTAMTKEQLEELVAVILA